MSENKNIDVTIGVPVYNGAPLIEESLQSLMDDDLETMKIVIYDNASTDETAQISQKFVKKDQRFSYVRNDENIGAIGNFSKALAACDTKYFAWRAYDDLSNPPYFTVLKNLLDQHEDAVLAAPMILTSKIAKSKQRTRPYKAGNSPYVLLKNSEAAWIYGLFRTKFIQKAHANVCKTYPHLWASDHLALFHAILHGGIVGSDAALFHQRDFGTGLNTCHFDGLTEKKQTMSDYYNYCMALVDEAGVAKGQRIMMQLAVMRHINRRVVRVRKLFF